MSFVDRFKPTGNNPPPGVKMEHTSFGYAQNQKPYSMPPIPKQNAPTQKVQPRGGWDNSDDDEPQLRNNNVPTRGIQTQPQGNIKKPFVQSPVTPNSAKSDELSLGPSVKKGVNPAKDYELMQIDDSFLSSHEWENKKITEVVQPGGARIKPADSVLNSFCKECETLQVPVVASLLMSKLYEDQPFITKARTLYLIEAIVKKVKKYYEYFKYNLSTLQGADYSNEGSADQLVKILNDIVQYIEQPNKPKQQPTFPINVTSQSPTIPQTTNLLGSDDLLGSSPEAKTSKPDPFAFVKKQPSETTKAQAPSSRTPVAQNNNNQLLDLDFGSQSIPSQPQQSFTPQTQSFSQPQPQPQPQTQSQAQPKKLNPFEIPSANVSQNQNTQQTPVQNVTQNTSKPSGLPGNFKKFQGASSSQEQSVTATPIQQTSNAFANKPTTPVNQNLTSNKMDDLLGSFSGLDFSGNSTSTQQTSSQPPQTTNVTQPTNSFNTGYQASSPGLQNNFGSTNAPSTQANQGPSSFGRSFSSNTGFNNGPMNSAMGQNQPMNTQMYPPYGGPGHAGFAHSNSLPTYGQGPYGFNAPTGNWNTGHPTGQSGFNANINAGPSYGYGQPPQYPQSGNFGQNFGGNNFPQGYHGMSGPMSYQNQPNMQGMNAYYNNSSQVDDMGGPLGMYSEEAIAKNAELKKKHEKAQNEALFDSLRF